MKNNNFNINKLNINLLINLIYVNLFFKFEYLSSSKSCSRFFD